MDKANLYLKMEVNTLDSTKMEKEMVKASIGMLMVRSTKDCMKIINNWARRDKRNP